MAARRIGFTEIFTNAALIDDELLDVIIETNANEDARSYDRPVMVEGAEARASIGELLTMAMEGASDEDLQAKAEEVNASVQALLDAE